MDRGEREFLYKIRDAIFSNPFGMTRLEIDIEASGLTSDASVDEVLKKLVYMVGQTIRAVTARTDAGGEVLLREDEELLRYGILFHTFHLYCDVYDAHIEAQVTKGDECCRVTFAKDVLQTLSDQGFGRGDALRFFALFFQMRRAFFFIRGIAGNSDSVMNLRRVLWNNVFTSNIGLYDRYLWNRMEDFSTMILGETGTGKGLAAAAIGRSGFIPFDDRTNTFSESFAKTFVSINLSQFPEQLIESELFGHKKGAFTGAVETHKGIFARCSPYGATFLDEIGDVSVPVQIKLLKVLQERVFSPVGSHKPEKFQGRVIAATNRSMDQSREEGKIRDDFYYRLCSDVIEVPPLRQRLKENPHELAEILEITVTRILGETSDEIVTMVHDFISANQPANYCWSGNIRELEQCVRRVILNNSYSWQLSERKRDKSSELAGAVLAGSFSAATLLSRYCSLLYQQYGSYEAVARKTELDRRTVKKYITMNAQR